jgi:hypothetical protein
MAPGVVNIGSSPGVYIMNYTARSVGGYGLTASHANGLEVERSAFFGCGAGGVHVQVSPGASIRNSYVRGFGERYPAGVGVVLTKSPNGTVAHCDISGGLYNGIVFGGTNDTGAGSRYELNVVHGNGHEADDGICDFGAIHGSNAGSLLPIYITSNVFHNITAYQNGGNGIYLDVSSSGVQVERNLVYDVAAETVKWNVNPGVPALPYPWPSSATPTRFVNNVLIAERDNEYGRLKAQKGRGNTNSAVQWTGYVSDGLHKLMPTRTYCACTVLVAST